MSNIIVSALVGMLLGLLIFRKTGPFGLFRFIKRIFYFSFKCETCTILWLSFIVYAIQAFSLGIILNWLEFLYGMLATGGLALVFAGLAQTMVEYEED